jgi:hypothetical protein
MTLAVTAGAASCTSPAAGGAPFGALDAVATPIGSPLTVRGWTIDPDTADPISVQIYVDGRAAGAAIADGDRPDVAAAYPQSGARHGYSITVTATPGAHDVCTYGIDSTGGTETLLGCATVTVAAGDPFGSLDVAEASSAGPGSLTMLRLAGWAIDPDTTAPVRILIAARFHDQVQLDASLPRPDVAAAYPAYGANHGFAIVIPLDPTLVVTFANVCVYVFNVSTAGSNTDVRQLGCRDLLVSHILPSSTTATT